MRALSVLSLALLPLAACQKDRAAPVPPTEETTGHASGAADGPVDRGGAPAADPVPVATGDADPPKASVGVPACTVDSTFPGVFPVAEASAAVEVELLPGVRELLVVSDSGQGGAAIAFALPAGPSRDLVLPLDRAAGDDTEGLAWRNGHLYALTSAGYVLAMTPDGKGGLERRAPAYPLGPPPFVCDVPAEVNCGKNYEGLCLRGSAHGTAATATASARAAAARCVGYAASRAEGALYCLSLVPGLTGAAGDRLVIDQVRPPLRLPVPKDSLSDCAFGSDDGPAASALLVSTNLHGGSHVYVADETTGGLQPIAVPGILNDEAIVVDHTGALYQAMDDNGTPSPAVRASCRW